jgi:hypothetical protein
LRRYDAQAVNGILTLIWLALLAAPTTQPSAHDDDEPSLSLPDGGVTLTVNLNDQVTLPGSRGKLTLWLKEAERGQATVALASASCDYIQKVVAHTGDEYPFHLQDQDYVLRVDKLVTMTFAEDYAVFTVLDLPSAQRQRVERDLSRIEQSDLVFLLDERECTGGEMARYLRQRLELLAKDEPAGAATQPIARFADVLSGIHATPATTTPSTTEPADSAPPAPPPAPPLPRCRVRTHEGRTIDLSAWLGEPTR